MEYLEAKLFEEKCGDARNKAITSFLAKVDTLQDQIDQLHNAISA